MKILAIDIGAGTEDILLYDDEKSSIENCIKMVLPSPCQVFAQEVRSLTALRKDIFMYGDAIGGGPLSYAIKQHIKSGLRVIMTKNSAYTIRNNLDQVAELGIEIVDYSKPINFSGKTIFLEEVNIKKLHTLLQFFGETFLDIDYVAIAVQDHGIFPKEITNRQFRIEKMKEMLEIQPKPEAFAFMEDEVPEYYPRMKSAIKASKRQLPNTKGLVMDTSPDAILGCLLDPAVKNYDPILVVNMGNGHTMAAIFSKDEIIAVMEHHTRLLDPEKMEMTLKDFVDGKLSNEKVFEENGHGLFFLKKPPGLSNIKKVVVTGPNRKILSESNLNIHFATPGGDVMMSGPIGLVEATKRKSK